MAKIVTYTTTVGSEANGTISRAKVPAKMVSQMGGLAGDTIEFTLEGKFVTGARVLRGRAAERAIDEARQSQADAAPRKPATPAKQAPAPAPKPKLKAKASVKTAVKAKAQAPKVKTPAKTAKRKTSVQTEVPKAKPAKATGGRFKLQRAGR